MWNSPARNLLGWASAKKAPWSERIDARIATIRPSASSASSPRMWIVTGEPGRDDVLGARLDPLHRLAQQQRGGGGHHIPWVDGHLVPEPAADVGGDDPDVLLGQPGHQGEERAVGMWCLAGEVDRRLPGRRVDVGDHPAGLQGRRVRPRVEGLSSPPCRRGECGVGPRLVARLPCVGDVVGLALLLVTDERGIGRPGHAGG